MKERIQKVLANFGVDSRRNIELMIQQGRISVNGKVSTRLPILIDPETDRVTVDDEPVRLATTRRGKKAVEKVYYLLNKPRGVYSTNVAQGEQRLARDLLPPDAEERIYPVGRLDAESKGLLLMTNDGDLTNLLTHPRYEVPKTYRAVIDGHISNEVIESLQEGIWLADKSGQGFKTGRSRVKVIHRSQRQSIVELTIREGRNRQVRRVLAKMGHKVRDLMRIKMGPLTLTGLSIGKVRRLTPREVKQLYSLAKAASEKVEETTSSSKSRPAARKPVKKAVAERARPEDIAVEFEDDELMKEVAAEEGGAESDGESEGEELAGGSEEEGSDEVAFEIETTDEFDDEEEDDARDELPE